MEEGKDKYPEGMVQRAMEGDLHSGDRVQPESQTKVGSRTRREELKAGNQQFEPQTKTDSRKQHMDKSSTAGNNGNAGRSGASGRGKGSFFRGLISGTVISDSFILKDIRYSAMIVVLAVVFIANRFNAERMEREITALEQEVSDLRAESLSVSADLGSVSRQSEITDLVKERGLGLEELREPPYRIVVNE
jgi:hypothetical protein